MVHKHFKLSVVAGGTALLMAFGAFANVLQTTNTDLAFFQPFGVDPIVTGPSSAGGSAGRIFTHTELAACDASCQAQRAGLFFDD